VLLQQLLLSMLLLLLYYQLLSMFCDAHHLHSSASTSACLDHAKNDTTM
jgi:hypothetical protein